MKVARAVTRVLNTLDETPLVDGLPHASDHAGPRQLVVVELETDDGVTGTGITYWHGALAPALTAAVEALAERSIGLDPERIETVHASLRDATGRTSATGSGIFHLAVAAIDMACWDIAARAAGRSVWSLIGGARTRVDAYASGALLRGYSLDVLERTAGALAGQGFHQLKMQCGDEPMADNVERVRVVREAVGDDVAVMCDVNQLWDVPYTIAIDRLLRPYRLAWIEDPITPGDLPGLARIAAAVETPVVAGEYLYGLQGFRQLLETRSVDIVMIDVLRAGGITTWLKIAALAAAHELPVVSHRLPEVDVHLVAGVPNGLTVEYRPLTAGLFEEVPELQAGQLVVPERHGLGLTLDRACFDHYLVREVSA